jgi:hypothetical protein
MIVVVAIYDLKIHQMDVKILFFIFTWWKVLYEQPLGLDKFGPEHKVCKLLHTTYGLKQSPHMWYECFNEYLLLIGFLKIKVDPNV